MYYYAHNLLADPLLYSMASGTRFVLIRAKNGSWRCTSRNHWHTLDITPCVPLTFRVHLNRYTIVLMISILHVIFSILSKNHIAERVWVEVNARVNYPVKACLIALQEAGDINMDCPHEKYCISWFTVRVCAVGASMVVNAWNHRPSSGTSTCTTVIAYIQLVEVCNIP